MIDKDEVIFAVDEKNNPIAPVARKRAHLEGIWHRTTDIVVLDDAMNILCHKRSLLKDSGPGLWDSAFGGHIAPGVEAIQGAIQELHEESGLLASKKDLIFLGVTKHISSTQKNREFRYCYVYHWNGRAEDIKFEADEISEVKWFDAETLPQELSDRSKWSPAPYLGLLLDYLKKQK